MTIRLLFVSVLFPLAAFAATNDPLPGVWAPAPEKWKVSPGSDGSEGRTTLTLVLDAMGEKRYRQRELEPSARIVQEFEWRIGEDSRLAVNGTYWQRSQRMRVDARHYRFKTSSSGGECVENWRISDDGNTLTVTRKGVWRSVPIRMIDEVLVYQRDH